MGRRRVCRQKPLASLTRVNTKAAEVFGSQVAANSAGNYIRQLSLEVVCSSRHDSGGASQMCCSEELLVAPAQLSQRGSGKGSTPAWGVLWEARLLQFLTRELQKALKLSASAVGLAPLCIIVSRARCVFIRRSACVCVRCVTGVWEGGGGGGSRSTCD